MSMVLKKKSVSMKANSDFFDKLFEPARKRIEKKIGVRVGQADFTEMLFKSRVNLDIKMDSIMKGGMNVRKNKRKK